MTHRAGAWMAAAISRCLSCRRRCGMAVAAAAEAALVAAAEAAAAAEGMSTGGGAGGCALRGMHMKRRAGGLAGTAKKPQTQRRACEYTPTYHWWRPWASQPQPPHSHRTQTSHAHRTTRSKGSHHQACHQARRRYHLPFTKGLASRRHSTRRLCYNSISPGSIGPVMAGAG